MVREFSAGGVVLRRMSDGWHIAAIEPKKEEPPPSQSRRAVPRKQILALPKGLIDKGEDPVETAIREVREETGVIATLIAKLADIKYVYIRTWADRERVFKVVSFYLLRYQSGRIDDVRPEMRIEVHRALWLPLEDAQTKLSYSGERQVVRKAQEYLQTHPEV
ncbi:MAG: NUDIX hydrolase [Acidobacteria bacterium]|nr:MAG: NUDIX hydrolase [Acidobacteriota bacterium]